MFVVRQFSLRLLLLEVVLFAFAFALFRASASHPMETAIFGWSAGAAAIGAAVGKLSNQMVFGAVAAFLLTLFVSALALPAVAAA